jgi:Ca2+-binding RTX toxin-like protein
MRPVRPTRHDFTLTNRSDDFDSHDEPGWRDGSCVSGGNGHDTIRADGDRHLVSGGNGKDLLVACGDCNTVDGGNGNDVIRAFGDDNLLRGGNGVDVLCAIGLGNVLDGGNGVDRLVSTSRGAFGEVVEGNVLTGGRGFDAFVLNNRSDLRVINDLGDDAHPDVPPAPGDVGVVSEGDVILGVMDEITDYTAGERLRIGAKEEADEPIGLDGFRPGHRHLDLADGEYAFIRGDQTGNGRFVVDDEGGDLLLVYDASDHRDALFLQGAVVLQGVTDADSVFIC